jgi:hypothetical protein
VWEESNKLMFGFANDTAPAEATRYAQVRDEKLDAFILDMVGYSELKAAGGVRRFVPEAHPRWPSLFATSVRFVQQMGEPDFVGPAGSLIYEVYELEIQYRDKPYAVLADEEQPIVKVATETWRYTTRNRTLAVHGQITPRNLLEFVHESAPGRHDPVTEPGSEFLSSASIKMTWWEIPCEEKDGTPQLPAGLRNNLDNSISKVNGDLFDDRYQRGTLLMLAPEENYRRMANGAWCCDIVFHLEQRGSDDVFNDEIADTPSWHHLRRGVDGKFWKIRRKGEPARALYDTFSFNDLFWPF